MPIHENIPWYRVRVIWLVIALPALALVGSAIVLALVLIRPDVEVHSERLDASPGMAAPR